MWETAVVTGAQKARGAATLGPSEPFAITVKSIMRRGNLGQIESVSGAAELGNGPVDPGARLVGLGMRPNDLSHFGIVNCKTGPWIAFAVACRFG